MAPGADAVKIDLFPLPYTAQPDGYPAVRHFGSTASCVSEDLPPLPVGSYEAWVRVGNSGALNALLAPVLASIVGALAARREPTGQAEQALATIPYTQEAEGGSLELASSKRAGVDRRGIGRHPGEGSRAGTRRP